MRINAQEMHTFDKMHGKCTDGDRARADIVLKTIYSRYQYSFQLSSSADQKPAQNLPL